MHEACPQTIKQRWHETHILPSELSRAHAPHTLKKQSCVDPAWPCRDKKTLLPNLEAELMVETWPLFKKDKAVLPLSTFFLILELQPGKFFGHSICYPPTLKPVSILLNHFSSVTLTLTEFSSALRHKGSELFRVLWNTISPLKRHLTVSFPEQKKKPRLSKWIRTASS